jgi:AsmA protein
MMLGEFMKKYLKFIGITIGILLLLFIVVAISIITLVSPNRLKPILTAQVLKYTGRQLIIDGDLEWTFFPSLGIKAGHMSLSNPPGFSKPLLAEIETANINVQLLPLLQNKIESNGMTLHGMKLYLIKNPKGQENWNFSETIAPTIKLNEKTIVVKSSSVPVSALGLAIAGVDVSDGQVIWLDEQTLQTTMIDHLELHAKNISFIQPFPITISFAVTSQQPAITSEIKLSTYLSVNMAKQIFSFRSLELVANVREPHKKIDASLKGDVVVDLIHQTLQSSLFHAAIENLKLTGKMSVTDLTTEHNTIGHITAEPFDLRTWLESIGQDVSNIQAFKTVKGDFDVSSIKNVMNIQGKLNVDEVEINHIKLTKMIIPVHFQNNVLNLAPVTANFYQGTLQTNIIVKQPTKVPELTLDSQLLNIQVGPLLDDLGSEKKKLKFSGTTNLDLHLTTTGLDKTSILNHLNGNSHFTVMNGTLEGVDIRYYLDVARAILAERSPTATNTHKTEFASLTGSADIKNGVIQNNDLVVTSSLFTTAGRGTINLISEQINYRTDTLVNQTDAMEGTEWADVAKISIPISVTGNLSDPIIQLDSSAITKALAKKIIQKTKEDIKEKIEHRIGGQGGALLRNMLNR